MAKFTKNCMLGWVWLNPPKFLITAWFRIVPRVNCKKEYCLFLFDKSGMGGSVKFNTLSYYEWFCWLDFLTSSINIILTLYSLLLGLKGELLVSMNTLNWQSLFYLHLTTVGSKLIEGMVRKPIVLSLLYAFKVEPVLTVHNVGLIFVRI